MRYTDDEKDARHERPATGPLPLISLGDSHVGWDASLAYAFNNDAQVYFRAATGFRAPTIQDRLEDDPEVTTADSETIRSYEIGYKALFEKVRFNVAGFYYEVDDMQLVAVGGNANTTTLLNAKEGVGYGVEFDVDIALTENLILSGGFGYNKTELNDKELTLPLPGHGLVTSRDPLDENGRAIIDGNPFQHAPEWTANIQLDYIHPLANGTELYLFNDWKLKGKTTDFLYESIEYTFGTQFEGGLRVGYRDTVRNFEIGMFARNITNEHNPIGGIDFANLLGYVNQRESGVRRPGTASDYRIIPTLGTDFKSVPFFYPCSQSYAAADITSIGSQVSCTWNHLMPLGASSSSTNTAEDSRPLFGGVDMRALRCHSW